MTYVSTMDYRVGRRRTSRTINPTFAQQASKSRSPRWLTNCWPPMDCTVLPYCFHYVTLLSGEFKFRKSTFSSIIFIWAIAFAQNAFGVVFITLTLQFQINEANKSQLSNPCTRKRTHALVISKLSKECTKKFTFKSKGLFLIQILQSLFPISVKS